MCRERRDGRFEITWKTTPVSTGASERPPTGEPVSPASPTTNAIDTEIAQAAAQGDPAPAAAEDPELAAVETPGLITELERRGYRTVQARQSKAAELDAAAARGVMPTKPVVNSHWNYHYQRRFDKLAELTAAGNWDAVAANECNGLNSYRRWSDNTVTGWSPRTRHGRRPPPRPSNERCSDRRPDMCAGGSLGLHLLI
jgi:hypothetical protein